MTIHYIANQGNLAIQQFATYLQEQDIHLATYDLMSLPKVDYLLIVKPIKVDSAANDFKYCSYSSIWHRWLFKKAPETILLSIGYAEQNGHPNYIDLLNLKPDFKQHLGKAKPVSSFRIYCDPKNSEQYIDEWQQVTIPTNSNNGKWEPLDNNGLPIRGANIIRRLKRFLDGHDALRGIQKHLIDIRITTLSIVHKLTEGAGYEMVKKDLLEDFGVAEWEILYSRWQVYKSFFYYTPFIGIADSLDKQIKEFNEGMSKLPNDTDTFLRFNPHQKLESILNTIDEVPAYVYEKFFCTT